MTQHSFNSDVLVPHCETEGLCESQKQTETDRNIHRQTGRQKQAGKEAAVTE